MGSHLSYERNGTARSGRRGGLVPPTGFWRIAALMIALPCALGCLFLAPSPASAAGTGEITGIVTDAVTHQPLEKINVCAYGSEGSSCAMTDPIHGSGEYVIAGLAEGSYKVGFTSIEHIYLTQFYSGKETEAEADPVSVSEGATTSGIDAAMQEGGRITGTVTAALGGAPIKGIAACALEAGGEGLTVSCGLTDAQGKYTIPELAEGSYKVEFSPGFCFECGPLSYRPQFYSGKESWTDADAVFVSLGATTNGIDVQMLPATQTLTVSPAGSGSGTVTSSPAGINCGPSCTHAFRFGSSVVLTALPAAGSTFTGWSGGSCSGTEPCHVTISGDTTVTATFAANGGGGKQPSPRTPRPKKPSPPSPPPPPNTKITKARIGKGKATFRFHATGAASGFRCALVRRGHGTRHPHFKRCFSPKTYRHLKPGRYLFSVRAVGAGGSDPTPAGHRFRIRG